MNPKYKQPIEDTYHKQTSDMLMHKKKFAIVG